MVSTQAEAPAPPATGASTGVTGDRAAASPRRFPGLLPQRVVRWRRPVWWQELAIILIGYWLYTLGRNIIPDQVSIAIRHGLSVQHIQDVLRLNVELWFNHLVASRPWLAEMMDYYYSTLHFIVTAVVLTWLFVRRPQVYRGARTVLVLITVVGLAGFSLYPTAPPRLLPLYSYVDTVAVFHTWGSLADPAIAAHSNQYAAMPSLHIGWALWCAVSVWMCARRLWVRLVALAYPLATLVVIVGTANHYLLDALASAVAVAISYAIQAAMSGHGAYAPPYDAPAPARPDPSAGGSRSGPEPLRARLAQFGAGP